MARVMELLIFIVISSFIITNDTFSIILVGFNEYLSLVFQDYTQFLPSTGPSILSIYPCQLVAKKAYSSPNLDETGTF